MNRKYRKTVIAGNWKMNKTPSETKEFMTQLKAITVLRYFLFISFFSFIKTSEPEVRCEFT